MLTYGGNHSHSMHCSQREGKLLNSSKNRYMVFLLIRSKTCIITVLTKGEFPLDILKSENWCFC